MKASVVTLCCFIVLGVASAAPSYAGLIYDTFTTGDGTGTVGGSVNGQLTETGGATWSGRNIWEYSLGGTLVVDDFGASGGPATRILSVPISIPAGQPVSVAADIIPPNTGVPSHWAALGFSNSSGSVFDSGFFTSGVGQLWMLLTKGGDYYFIAGSGTIVGSGPAPAYNASGFNQLEIDLDTASNMTTARVNGTAVVSNFDLDTIPFTPNINEAGFHFFGSTAAEADNFLVTIVPEPGAAMLMCLAFSLMGLARRPTCLGVQLLSDWSLK